MNSSLSPAAENKKASSAFHRHLNWYYDISDTPTRHEFYDFNRERGTTKFFYALLVLVTLVLLPNSVHEFIHSVTIPSDGEQPLPFAVFSTLLMILATCYGWSIHFSYDSNKRLLETAREKITTWFEGNGLWKSKFNKEISRSRPSDKTLHTSSDVSSILSAQRIEISVMREFSGRSISSSRRIAPLPSPSFLAALPINAPIESSSGRINGSTKSDRLPSPEYTSPNPSTSADTSNICLKSCNIPPLSLIHRTFFLTCIVLYFNVLFIRRGFELERFNVSNLELINPSLKSHFMEYDTYFIHYYTLLIVLLPYFISVALPDLPIISVWLTLVVSFLSLVSVLIFLSAYPCLVFVIVYFSFSLILTIDMQIHKVQFFLTTRKLGGILEENERTALESHAQEMRHMIANVAHDLKTPLASFLTGLDVIQMIMDDCKSDRFPSSSLGSCVNNMRTIHAFMLMTINRCIDYTKASKGLKLVPQHNTLNLLEALEMPLNCMRSMQQKIEIVLRNIPNEICPYVITDKQWLQENILCLLSNAVKYSADGVVSINIELAEYYSEGWKMCTMDGVLGKDLAPCGPDEPFTLLSPFLRFEIEDTGIGMSEDAIASLFNPFKQTQRLAGGTGLGLYSLAKRLEALHGFYGVMKRKDGKQGSLFWFAIPYKPDPTFVHNSLAMESGSGKSIDPKIAPSNETSRLLINDAPLNVKSLHALVSNHNRPDSVKREEHPSGMDQSLRILLVDDSPTILKMSSLMLKKLGHHVRTAENGAIAVKLIEENSSSKEHFDVILMDLQMPVMDGLEATRRIRSFEADQNNSSDTKKPVRHVIIGMSANSDHDTSLHAHEMGVDAFLPKPFRAETLCSTLNGLMGNFA